MPWSVAYDPVTRVVETVYAGQLPPADLKGAIVATIAAAEEHGVIHFLGDCSALAGGHTVVELYALADLVEQAFAGRSFREAIILPQLAAAASDVAFWETTCANRGLTVRVFPARDAALAWLLS